MSTPSPQPIAQNRVFNSERPRLPQCAVQFTRTRTVKFHCGLLFSFTFPNVCKPNLCIDFAQNNIWQCLLFICCNRPSTLFFDLILYNFIVARVQQINTGVCVVFDPQMRTWPCFQLMRVLIVNKAQALKEIYKMLQDAEICCYPSHVTRHCCI